MTPGTRAAGHPHRLRSGVGARMLPLRRPRAVTGIVTSVLAVALATMAIFGLKQVAPIISLSVVYLPAILLVSIYWGALQGLVCSLLSAAAFNFFHLPPTGRFTIADRQNWVSLVAFVIVALAVSAVAELARGRAVEAERRSREADLAAAMARELLLGEDTERALGSTARRVAEALDLSSAAIVSPHEDPGSAQPPARNEAIALRGADGEHVATLLVPRGLDPGSDHYLRAQVAPTLAALVAIARRRDAMQAQRVQTEALRRSDDIKTALLRAVSHDLRTPLTSIVAAGHALGSPTVQGAERVELSESIVSEAQRLADLVDKLLDLSRLQAGAARPRADWVSIEELVTTAAESRGGLDYRLAVDPDVPEIRADAAQLERALANLLENARRYGGDGPVHVHARLSGDRVLVSVVDRGPGIDLAEQPRIFEPFYRVAPTAQTGTANGVGSGLGLAIVKGFVEANGGTISVRSLPGQGTSFQISLPAAGAPDGPAAPPVTDPLPAVRR